MSNIIQIKRGNLSDIPILASGEFGFVEDAEQLYIGTAVSNIKILTNDDLYVLPVAATTIGGVKSGTDITVDGSGNVSVNKSGGLTWGIIAVNTTAIKDNGYLVNTSASAIELLLPINPTEGDTVGVCDYYSTSSTNNITILRNGQNIEGISDNLLINVDGAGITLVFTDATRGWEIVSEIMGPVSLVNDDSPQLGANLDLNGNSIEFLSVTVSDVLDEDTMSSNSNTKLATQQSIKAYVDTEVTAVDTKITAVDTKITTETVYSITGTTPELSVSNGTIQTWVLTANSTPTDGLSSGQSITLMINDGTAFTINWTSVSIKWVGGDEPELDATNYSVIELWKVGTQVYGAFVGVPS